jgi:hypothetical membrane protein
VHSRRADISSAPISRRISHRGLTVTPCGIVSPSSLHCDSALIRLGLLSLGCTVLFFRATQRTGFSILFGIFGLGSLTAGAVPQTLLSVHVLGSVAAFIGGSIAAMLALRFLSSPLKYCSLAVGLLSFACLISLRFDGPFYRENGIFGLGFGGSERMMVSPIIIWVSP